MSYDFAGAPCIGKTYLFESTAMVDHIEARKLCEKDCAHRAACELLRLDVIANTRGTNGSGGGPVGTWNGRLYGSKGLMASCGTDSGYRRHTRTGEPHCEDCKAAHAKVTSEQARRRRAA
jgi:hypothetical protein